MATKTKNLLARSLSDQVAEHLRMDLLCGLMNPGEPLLENQLVERFGVSRTPIRSALARLTQEGLLEAKSHQTVQVATQPPNEILDLIILIRCNVEVFALRTILDDLGREDFDHLEEILAGLKKACKEKNYSKIAEGDLSFHRYIIQRAGYADLEAIWMSIFARVRHHFLQTQKEYQNPMTIYQEHRQLLQVFKKKDIETAVAALAANIE
jgi:DNA-binding GntR family transcriptional regulator